MKPGNQKSPRVTLFDGSGYLYSEAGSTDDINYVKGDKYMGVNVFIRNKKHHPHVTTYIFFKLQLARRLHWFSINVFSLKKSKHYVIMELL